MLMRSFTLVNLLTKTVITLDSAKRVQAQHAATTALIKATGQYTDHCYWVERQEYHDVTGFKVLA